MKYLCTADWQAGVTTLTLDQQEPVWHRIADLAIEHRVDGVLHAGDLLEGPTLTTEVLAAVRRVFARLRAANIPVLLIRGNGRHDLATRDVDGIDLFHDVPGITVSQRPELIDFAGAAVVTLPWVSPKHLIASVNGATRESVYEHAADLLVGIASDLRDEAERSSIPGPRILLLHWSVSGASLPSGLPVDRLREVVLPWPDLDALSFDAVVCGHIHKPQRFPGKPDSFYCGSPQPLNHGEAGEHGVWLIEGGDATFLPIDSPQFVTLDIDPCADLVLAVDGRETPLGMWPVREGSIVRVRYTATREQAATIDKNAIRQELLNAGASRVTIEPSIIREARARAEHLTETLTELDALAAYSDAQGIDQAMRDRMIERTGEWL